MDGRVRDYLIHAHNKVIAHYHQLLGTSSLTEPERQLIQRRLARAKTELEAVAVGSDLYVAEHAQTGR